MKSSVPYCKRRKAGCGTGNEARFHCLNEVCNCHDVTSVYSLNSRKLPDHFSLPKRPGNEAILYLQCEVYFAIVCLHIASCEPFP